MMYSFHHIYSATIRYGRLLLFASSLLLPFSPAALAQKKTKAVAVTIEPIYKNPSASIDDRVTDLMNRMTLEEKVGQLLCPLGWEMYTKEGKDKVRPSDKFIALMESQHVGMFWATLRADPWTRKTLETGLNPELAAKATNALQKYAVEKTRLGIPIFFAEECPHGHMAIGTTVFPTSIGQSSTWDPELIRQMAAAIAKEARLQGAHIGYGPVLDLAREPRWSRTEETYGEDPVLNSRMGEAMVKGFQGSSLGSSQQVISTLKHFTAYGVPEGGHNGGSVSIGQRELHESYLAPFRAAVKAGALSVMTAYNSIDGIPCSANSYLLNDVLRTDWGFRGYVVSDLGSIEGIRGSHRVAGSIAEAARMALVAGLDVDLGGNAFRTLKEATEKRTVDIRLINQAVERVLRLKFEMGLFENPYTNPALAKQAARDEHHVYLAREVARKSIVLLKNEKNTLPLRKNYQRIAVIGPNADNMYNQLGDYTAPQEERAISTVLKGVRAKVSSGTTVDYVKGCAIRDTSNAQIAEAVQAASLADVCIVVVGGSSARDFKTKYIETGAAITSQENTLSDMESGEGFDRVSLDLMGKQLELLQAVAKTGKPLVVVYLQGRPLNMNWAAEHANALLCAWYPGQEGGHAVADVLFGDYNPAGRLPISVPRSVGQLPVYYNQKNPLPHNYVEMSAKPLYSFGYGLSYTAFEYEQLEVEEVVVTRPSGSNEASSDRTSMRFNIACTVINKGDYDGEEVVQLYLRDEKASVVRPNKQLKQFERVSLRKGERKTIRFRLDEQDFLLMDRQGEWAAEPRTITVMIGAASDDIRLKKELTIGS